MAAPAFRATNQEPSVGMPSNGDNLFCGSRNDLSDDLRRNTR